LALNKTYGLTSIACQSPIYQSSQIDKDKITIQFNNAANGLVAKGESITCFEIAGADKVFYKLKQKLLAAL
jgi:sialate O-acetylesterase